MPHEAENRGRGRKRSRPSDVRDAIGDEEGREDTRRYLKREVFAANARATERKLLLVGVKGNEPVNDPRKYDEAINMIAMLESGFGMNVQQIATGSANEVDDIINVRNRTGLTLSTYTRIEDFLKVVTHAQFETLRNDLTTAPDTRRPQGGVYILDRARLRKFITRLTQKGISLEKLTEMSQFPQGKFEQWLGDEERFGTITDGELQTLVKIRAQVRMKTHSRSAE